MPEKGVLNLPMDKFWLYTEAEERRRTRERKMLVMDTAGAIAGVFGKDGIESYIKHISGDSNG